MTGLYILTIFALACIVGAAMLRLWQLRPVKAAPQRQPTPEQVGQRMARELHMRRRTRYTDEHVTLSARIVPGGWALKGGGADTCWHSLVGLEDEVARRVHRSRLGEHRVIPFPTAEVAPQRERDPAGAA